MTNINLTVMELEKYAELEGSEWGGTVYAMLQLYQLRTLISPRLIKALESEMIAWLKDVEKNAEIVEEVITPEPYTVKTLEWY